MNYAIFARKNGSDIDEICFISKNFDTSYNMFHNLVNECKKKNNVEKLLFCIFEEEELFNFHDSISFGVRFDNRLIIYFCHCGDNFFSKHDFDKHCEKCNLEK